MQAESPTSQATGLCLSPSKPLTSLDVVVPAYNERAVLHPHVRELAAYLAGLSADCDWRILIVNDGSDDGTGALAEDLAGRFPRIHVIHHARNQGLGAAIRTGAAAGTSDFLVTMDADLSYSPPHIGRMLQAAQCREAHLVLASPYLQGGYVSGVPLFRALLSRAANRYLFLMSGGRIHTFTCMVRAFRRSFLDSIQSVSTGPEINLEVLMKAMQLGVPIAEVPAHLCWRNTHGRAPFGSRWRSVSKQILHVLRWGVRLRAVMAAGPASGGAFLR
jgi:glycosyltransferase involved in cell wall biosynthesis